jgi:hypothetical protein
MAKNKHAESNGAVLDAPAPTETQPLLRISFEDLERLEEVETEPAQPAAPANDAPAVDTDEQVLSTLETFEQAFAGDPLAKDYLELGNDAAEYSDPKDGAQHFVRMGVKAHNLMVREHNNAPNSYKRPNVIKKIETAFRLCGANLGVIKPQEVVQVYWVVKLDRSTPGAEGERRSLPADETPDEWFGGNIKVAVLRSLAKCVYRASKDNELDVWDVREGYEPFLRDSIKSLRNAQLSGRQVDRLYDAHKQRMADAKKREKYQGLTPDEIASVESAEKNATLQSRLNELGSMALDVQKFAADELKKGGAELKEFLANRGIIPGEKFVTPQEYAAQMTPGDAKALVQELIKLYATKPDRLAVFKTLYATCKSVVEQLRSAQESTRKAG